MRKTHFLTLGLITFLTASCDPGTMRAISDSFSEADGYEVVYYDQSSVDYIGEVRHTYGVYNGEGFYELDNEGADYYQVRLNFEDGGEGYHFLDPYETTGRIWMSVYNQIDSTEAIYGNYPGIFDEDIDG